MRLQKSTKLGMLHWSNFVSTKWHLLASLRGRLNLLWSVAQGTAQQQIASQKVPWNWEQTGYIRVDAGHRFTSIFPPSLATPHQEGDQTDSSCVRVKSMQDQVETHSLSRRQQTFNSKSKVLGCKLKSHLSHLFKISFSWCVLQSFFPPDLKHLFSRLKHHCPSAPLESNLTELLPLMSRSRHYYVRRKKQASSSQENAIHKWQKSKKYSATFKAATHASQQSELI